MGTVQFQGDVGLLRGRDRFVEAERRAQRLLNHRVAHQIVRRQGLFDHRQAEVVQPAEDFHLIEAHGRFDVDMEAFDRELVTHEVEHVDFPAGTHLQFNPGEARVKRPADRVDELVGRLHLVERRADFDRFPAAAENLVERLAVAASLEIPPSRVEGRLGEPVAMEAGQGALEIVARVDHLACQMRRHAVTHAAEHAGRPLGPGEGALPGLASPQPAVEPLVIRTSTVSSLSDVPAAFGKG